MRIIIEETLKNANYYNSLNFIGKQAYDLKFAYVFHRLYILNDELRVEEYNNPKAEIKLIMEGKTVNELIKISGYSKKLTEKVNGSFDECDARLLESKLYDLICNPN